MPHTKGRALHAVDFGIAPEVLAFGILGVNQGHVFVVHIFSKLIPPPPDIFRIAGRSGILAGHIIQARST